MVSGSGQAFIGFGPSAPTGRVRLCQREQIHQTNTPMAPLALPPPKNGDDDNND